MALRAAVLLLAAAVAGGAACSASEEPARPAPQPADSVLAIARDKLAAVDPLTLRRIGEKEVEVGGHAWPWAFSPDGSALALTKRRSIRLVDVRGARVVGDLEVPRGFAEHLAWPAPRRLIVVQALTGRQEVRFLLLDPVAGVALAQRRVPAWQGWPLEVVAPADAVAALVLPRHGIGAAGVAAFDARGRLRVVRLPRIMAGSEWTEVSPGYDAVREIWPALAADPRGARAFVFGANDLVAEIDLPTMEVGYARLREDGSLLGRLHDWIEPEAEAKVADWHQIGALWLGDGRIALFGRRSQPYMSGDGGVHERDHALGLRLVDTRDWTFRIVDESATSVVPAGELLLASAWLWDSEAQEHHGIGLRAYTRSGERVFHALGRGPILGVSVAGRYAYADMDTEVAVVDLDSGEVVGERSRLPLLIDRE